MATQEELENMTKAELHDAYGVSQSQTKPEMIAEILSGSESGPSMPEQDTISDTRTAAEATAEVAYLPGTEPVVTNPADNG